MSTVVDSLIVKLEAEISQYEAEMVKSQKVLDAVRKSTDQLSDSQMQVRRSSEEVALALKKLDNSFAEMDKKVSEFERQVKEGERVWLSVATAAEKYGHEVSKLTKLLEAGAISQETFNRAAAKLEKEFGQGLSERLIKIGDGLVSFGKKMTLGVTAPVVGFGALAFNEFAKFDQAMTRTQAIAGITADSVGKVRAEILGLSASGEVLQGPAELARGLEALSRVTQDSSQALQLLPQAANFATIAQENLTEATNNLTEVQRAVGLASEDAAENMANFGRVSDVLVGATTISQLSVRQLSDSLTSLAGQTLRQFNKSIEEGTAVLIEFGRQGFTNARAGTMLSRIMLQLAKASRDAADAHKTFGLEVFNAEGAMNNMADIVKQLTTLTAGMNEEMIATTFELLGIDQITQRALIPLLGFGDAIAKNQEELEGITGITKRLSDEVMESFSNRIEVLKNQLVVLGLETASNLLPIFENLMSLLQELLDWFNSLSSGTQKFIGTLILVTAAIGPLAIALGFAITTYASLVVAIEAGTVAMAAGTVAAGMLQIAIYSLATLGVAALAVGIAVLISSLWDWMSGNHILNDALREQLQLHEQILSITGARKNEELRDTMGVQDLEERIKAAEELAAIEKRNEEQTLKRAEAQLKRVQQEVLAAGATREKDGRPVQAAVDEAFKAFDDNKGITGFHHELDVAISQYKLLIGQAKISNETHKRAEKIVEDSTKALEKQAELEKKMIEERAKAQKKIEEVMNATKLAKEQEEALKKMSKDFDAYVADLERAGKQVRESLLSPTEKFIKELEKLEDLRRFNFITTEEFDAKAEELALKTNLELNKEHNDLLKRREQLLNQTLTPQEKYNQQLEEAQMLFDKGIINVGEFNQLVGQAFEEMQGKADIDVRFHTSGLDGVEAQSAEAFSRIRATMSLGQSRIGGGLNSPDLMQGQSTSFRTAGQAQPKDVRDMVEEMKEARRLQEEQNEILKAILESSPNFVPANLG